MEFYCTNMVKSISIDLRTWILKKETTREKAEKPWQSYSPFLRTPDARETLTYTTRLFWLEGVLVVLFV